MFLKSQLTWNVVIPAENLDSEGSMLQRSILVNLMNDFATKKASNELGYFLAITTLDSVGEGKIRQYSGELLFPVTFSCITFKILTGEVLEGTVHRVTNLGVFLRCGPADKIYLSHKKMAGYCYIPGEKPFFGKENSPRIDNGVVLRFVVMGVSFVEAESDFQAVVGMDGDYLGPVERHGNEKGKL